MADLDLTRRVTEQQDAQETQKDKSNTRTKLAALAMGAIISGTQVQASDLLAQCDFNHDGKISTRKTYKADGVPRAVAKKEFKCKLSYENVQLDQEIEQGRIVLTQLDMSLENLQKELREVEAELSKNKAELSKNKAELSKNKAELSKNKAELSKNKAELEKKRKWLKKQIEKIIKNSINIS